MKKRFTIAIGTPERWELQIVPEFNEQKLEEEGFSFGLFLLENASSDFLRGLALSLDEAEIRKKIGLGH